MNLAMLASGDPLSHVYQWAYQHFPHDPVAGVDNILVPGGQVTLVSNHIVMQVIAVLLLVLVIPRFASVRASGDAVRDLTPKGFRNFFEAICSYLRDTVARPVLGEHTDQFIPYIWTAFYYILFINLLGLLPLETLTKGLVRSVYPNAHHGVGGSATGNIWVTASLATCTLFMIVFNGLRYNGMAYVKHFFQGPVFIAPLIAFLEVIGLIAKCFALTVRLFANMVAGHVLLAVLLSFISASYVALGAGAATGIGIAVVVTSIAFNLLEVFVAFLQAFIFTFLTTLFIGQAVVIHHEHAEDHGHGTAEPAHAEH